MRILVVFLALTSVGLNAESPQSTEAQDGAAFAAAGVKFREAGMYSEARVWLQRALEIRERWFGLNDVLVADTLSDLGLVCRLEGKLVEAEGLYRSALTVYRSHPDARNYPVTLNNLGRVAAARGRAKEAERMYRQSIALSEQMVGPNHPDVAAELSNLAMLLCSQRKFREADLLLRRARQIDRQSFSPEDARIAHDLNDVGILALARKQYADAEVSFQQALALFENILPAGHPTIGRVTAGLAEVYRRQGRLEESSVLYTKAVRILEEALGPENPQLLSTLESYALLLRARKDYALAASVDVRTMKIRVVSTLRMSLQ